MRGVTNGAGNAVQTAEFLLTRLMRGVTSRSRTLTTSTVISTHTPHARRDGLLRQQ